MQRKENEQFLDELVRRALIVLICLEILLIGFFIVWLPGKDVVLIELIIESTFLMVCIYIFYHFIKFRFLIIIIGWNIFCFGLSLDVLDEFLDTERLLHKNLEDVLAMVGVSLVAYGFHLASDQLKSALSDAKRNSRMYRHLANTDKLTGLASREKFVEELEKSIEQARKEEKVIAVLFIDLNKFKPVNDTYGHEVGDLLLVAASRRIKTLVRFSDLLCRWGGDEFLILQGPMDSQTAPVDLAERILEKFRDPFHVRDLSIDLGASIGYSLFPLDSDNARDLVKKADLAMYEAKKTNKSPQRFCETLE